MELNYVGFRTQLHAPAYPAGRDECSLYMNITQYI